MAITVAGYYEVSNWYATGTSNNVTGVSWSSGDVIVVAQYVSDDNSTDITAPTNANLTFTLRQAVDSSGTSNAQVDVYTATAGSPQSSQTITSGRSGLTNANGAAVWVLSGADAYRGGFANGTESATSYTPLADSVVCYIMADWNAAGSTRTGTTGSGTRTEREDSIDGSWGGVWVGEWLGTTNTSQTYGLSSYTGMKVAQVAVEITAAAAGGPTGSGAPSLARHAGAGSGSTTAPAITGTSATTLARHTGAGSGSSGTEGSGAPSLARVTGAGSGSTAVPSASGSGAPTLARSAAAGAGSTTGIEGSSATTLVRHAGSGSGSTTGVVGTSATTLARHTAAGSGSTTAPGGSGSGAPTLARHTAAGSGSTGTSGSGSPSLTRHTAAGTGSTGTSGSGSPTCARHTASGSGSTTGLAGTSGVTLVRHSIAGSGASTAPAVTGSAAVTLRRHTAAGTDQLGPTGSGAPALVRHTASGSGRVVVKMTRLRAATSDFGRDAVPPAEGTFLSRLR